MRRPLRRYCDSSLHDESCAGTNSTPFLRGDRAIMSATRFIACVTAAGAVGLLAALPARAGDNAAAGAAGAWRQAHERQILVDFFAFLRIPNVSSDLPNVRR